MKYLFVFLLVCLFVSCGSNNTNSEQKPISGANGNFGFYKVLCASGYSADGIFVRDWMEANKLSFHNDSINIDTTVSIVFESISPTKKLEDFLISSSGCSIGYVQNEQNKKIVDEILGKQEIKTLFEPEVRFLWGSHYEKKGLALYACWVPETGKAIINGSHIANIEQDGATVNLEMTNEGSDLWERMTEEHLGKQVAITLNNMVYCAPIIRSVIRNGISSIKLYSISEAKELVQILNSKNE